MMLFLASYGRREILLFGLFWLFLGAVGPYLFPPLAALPALGLLFPQYFLRVPRRVPPPALDLVVSPADGTVVEVSESSDTGFLSGETVKVGIFLSVFNVHVNRAPCAGVVKSIRYTPGTFRDARDPSCGQVNEQNAIHIDGPVPVIVTQIAGAIARRIVCALRENETVAKGQRIGMIKFGSRTDVVLPKSRVAELRIRLGDKVKGGETVLARVVAS